MAVKMNLWSLTLMPGEAVPIYVRRDFQITNAALAEDLASADGRSVVKVTHSPIPDFDDSDDEFDSELDSDDEMDEDELDELDEETAAKLKAALEEADAEEDEDDAEDDEDEDDEDDSDDEDDIPPEEVVMCSLTAGKIEQAQLNLTFPAGDVVIFEVTGENAVHLLGNYIDQGDEMDSDYDSDYEGHDDYSDLDFDEDDEFSVEEFDEEVEIAPKGKITEIKAAKAVEAAAPKRKAAEIEEKPELSKAQQKKAAKKAKTEEAAAPAPKKEAPKKEAPKKEQSKKRTLPSGLVIEDTKVGTGPVAKAGKRLGMRYIGKLDNGKQFDANTAGKPFSFVLGRSEVIAGWDQGLAGMAVGGERRLTIPAKLAYGKQRIPGIPPNSTLNFDVKLVSVN